MSRAYIPKALRQKVSNQAHHRCGYCLTSETIVGTLMEIDHIVPKSFGGLTEEANLWLTCSQCNDHKNNRVSGFDASTGKIVGLFNLRTQDWNEHFNWTVAGDEIIGKTPIGRATVITLELNREELVRARQLWLIAGWHPPKD